MYEEARLRIAVRHIGRATLLGAGALATTLAAEVMAARRHRFLVHETPLEISGMIGPEDGEPLTLVVLGDSSVAGVGAGRPPLFPPRLYRAELAPHGISVFDIAKLTKSAFHGKREMFSADLFHPSSAGYAFLATIYGRAVREALEAASLDLQGDPEGEPARQ